MGPEVFDDLVEAFEQVRALAATSSPVVEAPEALSSYLYANWFHQLAEVTYRAYPTPGQFGAATALPDLFRPGWSLVAVEAAGVRARGPDGGEVTVSMGDVAPQDPVAPLVPGAALRVLDRTTDASSGFWHLWSPGWRRAPPERVERLYLAIASGAELDVARALALVAPIDGTWYAKFLAGTHPAGRRDPCVLYVSAGATSAPWVDAFLERTTSQLTGARVRATAVHAAGVGVAADPGGGRSFGQAVCDALAAAAAEPEARRGVDEFLAAVRRHAAAGDLLGLEAPA